LSSSHGWSSDWPNRGLRKMLSVASRVLSLHKPEIESAAA
jgi:hypothetical protein